jgi:acyl-CoA reductase-like NAD-dependent aldehyde dehydrogenase
VWAALSPGERRKQLLKAADLLDARTAGFINIGTAEIGGTPEWYEFNVMLAANMLREAAAMTTQISGEVIPSNVPDNLAMAVRQLCGVVLGIAPWNVPVILAVSAVAMPLACGNTVVLMASEQCPGIHGLIGKVSSPRNSTLSHRHRVDPSLAPPTRIVSMTGCVTWRCSPSISSLRLPSC